MKALIPLVLPAGILCAQIPANWQAVTVDIPALSVEIVAFSSPSGLILGTNSHDQTLEITAVANWNPLRLVPWDSVLTREGNQGVKMSGNPTSVVAHPTLPLAFVSIPDEKTSSKGSVVAVGLAPNTSRGRILKAWEVGYHPDSIAISPDGRWLATACEGAGKHHTPGSVNLIRLDGMPEAYHTGEFRSRSWDLGGLGRRFGCTDDDVEPEYVSFDPDSRFLVVSCQENDAVLLVDVSGPEPVICQVIRTLPGAWPDGVAIHQGLIATADEGDESKTCGQSVSFFTFDPAHPSVPATRIHTLDMRPIANPGKPGKNCDPENIKLASLAGKTLALVVMEDRNGVAVLDVTHPAKPASLGILPTGTRPEGLLVMEKPDHLVVITGDEGESDGTGPGEITVGEIRLPR